MWVCTVMMYGHKCYLLTWLICRFCLSKLFSRQNSLLSVMSSTSLCIQISFHILHVCSQVEHYMKIHYFDDLSSRVHGGVWMFVLSIQAACSKHLHHMVSSIGFVSFWFFHLSSYIVSSYIVLFSTRLYLNMILHSKIFEAATWEMAANLLICRK